jgi:hypothetical protein
MGVFDCMLLNARLMWNMSVDSEVGRLRKRNYLERYEFMHVVAHELMTYETPALMSPPRQSASVSEDMDSNASEQQQSVCRTIGFSRADRKDYKRCVVCQLEESLVATSIEKYRKASNNSVTAVEAAQVKRQLLQTIAKGNRRYLSTCECCPTDDSGGGLTAHSFVLHEQEKNLIHTLFEPGMTCMEILHSDVGKELWKRRAEDDKKRKRFSCTVARKHDYMTHLKELVNCRVADLFKK